MKENMWETIKKILSKEGGKCIIIENGQPAYLVMKMEEYEKGDSEDASSEIEKANRDIAQLKAAEEEKPEPNEEVKIEDLPF